MKKEIHLVNDLCVSTDYDYANYLDNLEGTPNSGGKCLGASLYWSTEFLKEVAGDQNTIGFKIKKTRQFFNFSHYVQSHSAHNFDGKDPVNRLKLMTDTLNKQEAFLSQRSSYSLKYGFINSSLMERNLNAMLSGSPLYKNKCIIVTTRLDKPVVVKHSHEGRYYGHATSLANYNGKLFFFDVNNCVYSIGKGYDTKSLLNLLSRSFGLVGNNINYGLSQLGGITIELSRSSTINTKINTSDIYYG